MKLAWTLATLLARVALADVVEDRATSGNCYTSFGPTRVNPIPTVSSTTTLTFLSTTTRFVHPTITITPPAVTSTRTKKSTTVVTTTVHAVTDTATVTNTVTTTSTQTAPTTTITSTSTSFVDVSTTVTSTSTVPTYAAFTPIQTSLPDSSNVQKRDWIAQLKARALLRPKPLVVPQAGYPERVMCEVSKTVTRVHATTYTGGSKVTHTAPTPTVVKTKVVPVTSTSSIFPPDVTSTVTSTLTNTAFATTTPSTTLTSTTTVTDTQTQTATATFLAQCAPDNYASESPQGVLINIGPLGTAQLVLSTLGSDYDCCAACAANPECSAGIYARGQQPDNCYFLMETFCVQQTPLHGYSVMEQTAVPPTLQFFNGNCGEFNAY